ncbi:MAG: dTMP kinase, partial [Planctomycetes bacterium]|nr:dTMP kinase [Planctomycetota bacterium]
MPSASPSIPRFIALEGVDGAGKSTQVDFLAAWLRETGREVITVREPGGTALGEAVRKILLDRQEIELEAEAEALLFLASRVQLYETVVRPALAEGRTVITDRFHLSTLVYQGLAGELGDGRTRALLRGVLGERRPDVNIVVRVPLATCRERLSSAPDRFESRAGFLERVHAAFESLASGDVIGLPGDRIIPVDGSAGPIAVAGEIRRLLVASTAATGEG